MITSMAKIFGFGNVMLNTLHCKIYFPNNVKVCSLPFLKFLEYYVSFLLEVYIGPINQYSENS